MNRTSQPQIAQVVRSSTESTDPIADELRRYDEHLRDVRGLSAGTRRNRCRSIEQLLRKKFADGVVTMAKLRPADIRRFIARQLGDGPSHSAASHLASALRSYLRYRAFCGDSVTALGAVISSPVQWKLSTLPHALKPDEVQRLLAAFPHGRSPRRGYAHPIQHKSTGIIRHFSRPRITLRFSLVYLVLASCSLSTEHDHESRGELGNGRVWRGTDRG